MKTSDTLIGLLLLTLFSLQFNNLSAQNNQVMVKVKTFNQELKPVAGIEISIDNGEFFITDREGSSFVEIYENKLPPKSIITPSKRMEVASWNYSRGTLEIILRKRTVHTITVQVRDNQGLPIKEKKISLRAGAGTLTATTNNQGIFKMVVPIDKNLNQSGIFSLNNYTIFSQNFSGTNGTVVVEPFALVLQEPEDNSFSQTFEAPEEGPAPNGLDSISTLIEFYEFIKQIEISQQEAEFKDAIDNKFNELIYSLDEDIQSLGSITDTSLVKNDVVYLIEQALSDSKQLEETQTEFDEKIAVINDKLEQGGGNLSTDERNELVSELDKLDQILTENENKFFENLQDYRSILNSIKSRLLQIQDLEEQLQISEQERLEEKKDFQNKLIVFIISLAGLALLAMIFIFLTRKFRKQKKDLEKANAEVERINLHLGDLVAQRTASLQTSNKELDTFLYRSSHDLKRPLTSIIGLSNIAKLTLEPEAFELFDKARQVASDMDKMLQKLLMVSQTQYPTDYGKIEFKEMIDEILKDIQENVNISDTQISTEIDEAIDFESFPLVVKVLLWNLIENAIIFTSLKRGTESLVKITIKPEDGNVVVNVNDNGVGINPEIEPKIWEMFFVGNDQSKGNGLGLYIAEKAAKALNGKISFSSSLYEFTEFTVILPLDSSSKIKRNIPEEESLQNQMS